MLGSGLSKDVSLLGLLLGAWILSSLGASGVRCGAGARSAMPWERRLEYWPTLLRMRVSNWLPEQGVSVVGVIADRDFDGTDRCNRILGSCPHFYSFETKG